MRDDKRSIRLSEYREIKERKELGVKLSGTVYKELKDCSYKNGLTVNAILQYAWHKLLSMYGNTNTTIVGTVISGRNLPIDNIEKSVGLFINTLPLIIKHKKEETLLDGIKEIQNKITEIDSHSNMNLAKLQTGSGRLFDSLFVYENYPAIDEDKNQEELRIGEFRGIEEIDYALGLIAYEQGGEVVVSLKYAGELFTDESIKNLLDMLNNLVMQITTKKIGYKQAKELSYLSQEDYQKVVYTWNATKKDYPADKTIHELFEEQVARGPDNVAVVYEGKQLKYRELNARSNQLARYLLGREGQLVAILSEKGANQVISTLAIMQSGYGYLPLNVEWPAQRLVDVLISGQVTSVLISRKQHANGDVVDALSKFNLIVIEDILENIDLEDNKSNVGLLPKVSSTDIAYVIFTSGSTGKPKGVTISHKGALNTILAVNEKFNVNAHDAVLALSELSFDLSVYDIFGMLIAGGKIVFPEQEDTKNTNQWINLISQHKITIWNTVPQLAGLLIDDAEQNQLDIGSLRLFLLSGDWIPLGLPDRIKKECTNAKVISLGGATEGSIWSIWYEVGAIDQAWRSIPYGVAMPNQKMHILDKNQNPCPIGGYGEICIGGDGVALNYWNDSERTSASFFDHQTLGRLYWTGDCGKWTNNGFIEYIGRNDFQVKVRGFRIELGEIESKLSAYPGIAQSVVLAKDHYDKDGAITDNKYIVGYYVLQNQLMEQENIAEPEQSAILTHVSKHLPDYMVPSILIKLDTLPLTINGKLDRQALPEPEFTNTDTYVAPRSELEAKVCSIYAEALNLPIDKVGINDDFFRLGGDSIVSIQLVSRLRQRLDLHVSVKDIFTYKSISRIYDNVISKEIISADNIGASSVLHERGILTGNVTLLPIQHWFFNKIISGEYNYSGHWNQSFLIKIKDVDKELLEYSVSKLIEYHDAFRLGYSKTSDNKYTQFYREFNGSTQKPYIHYLDINSLSDKLLYQDVLTSWQSKFKLSENNPLYSIGYIEGFDDNSSRIFIALHHLLIDTVSWRIIVDDLHELYDKLLSAQQANKLNEIVIQDSETLLGRKGTSYRQWAELVNSYGKLHVNEFSFWENMLSELEEKQKKLQIFVPTEAGLQEKTCVEFKLDRKTTKLLLTECNLAYHTEINDLLLSAFGLALSNLIHDTSTYITLEGHGREDSWINDNVNFDKHQKVEITRTIGWFTTMYPVKLEIFQDSLSNTIINIKDSLRKIKNKGIGYGVMCGYSKLTLPKVSFNYLGQFDQNNEAEFAYWNITDEQSGVQISESNVDSNIINANGMVSNGELRFVIRSKLNQAILNTFMQEFKDQLNNIIKYTASHERSYLTASDIDNIISQTYLDKIQKDKEIHGMYLANSLQQGFIYHALNQGLEDTAYRVQLVYSYANQLDPEVLKISWQCAINKYPSLRLRFAWDEELLQIIDANQDLEWYYLDISAQSQKEQEITVQELIKADKQRNYDLITGNLLRIYLLKQAESQYICIQSNHHAILDGWSNPILLEFVHEMYQKFSGKIQYNKSQLINKIQVDDSYTISQKYLQENNPETENYWLKERALITEYANLNGLLTQDKRDIKLEDYKIIREHTKQIINITATNYQRLKEFTQENGITINAVLQFIWHKLLNIYGNTNVTVVGTTISGRNLPIDDIESSVGLYINTLPLIVEHGKEKTIHEVLRYIQDKITDINTHSNVSLSKLQKEGRRLFTSLFVYENYPTPKNKKDSPIKTSFIEAIEEVDYPLGVIAQESNNQITLVLKYAGELFARETITKLLETFQVLITQIVKSDKVTAIKSLSYLNEETYTKVINDWNNTERDYPANKTLHELFEEQVARSPDNVAVMCADTKLTYNILNQKSNQLASYLRETYQIQSDDLISLCLDRSEVMLIAIMAILKSGAAYVPIDQSYSNERIKYILNDADSKVILTNSLYADKFNEISLELERNISIESIDNIELQQKLNLYTGRNTNTINGPTNLAYVIYTSGTTGKPKGVMLEHRSVVNYIFNVSTKIFEFNQANVDFSTNIGFDLTVTTTLGALCNGAKICIYDKDVKELDEYKKHLFENKITLTKLVPSYFELLVDDIDESSLKQIILGGEKVSTELLNKIKKNDLIVYDEYGPTEATVGSCLACIYENGRLSTDTGVGSAYANYKFYILNIFLQPLPIGAIGDLYIGGAGLARGYLNKPELTEERFIANPFQTDEEKSQGKNGRLYKTGDLVRYLADGNVEYIGRNDFQVKIRGYRIELGEIESKLCSYPGVKQSVVLAKEHKSVTNGEVSGNKYLVGYYVASTKLDEALMLKDMANHLPEYMIPSKLQFLEKLPLTINGKLDKNALPEINFIDENNYIAPRTELEAKVCEIFAEILRLPVDKVGINDDFFKLGGNSILAIKLTSKLFNALSIKISIATLFKFRTIQSLLSDGLLNGTDAIKIERIATTKNINYKLSFAQERLWFIDQYEGGSDAYNIPLVMEINKDVNLISLERALQSTVARHEVLHTFIRTDKNGGGYQEIGDLEKTPFLVTKQEFLQKNDLLAYIDQEVNHIFRLEEEYPIRSSILNASNISYLCTIIHHIASDGWSTDIFLRDIHAYYVYYEEYSNNKNTKLGLSNLTIQYKDFAIWQRMYLSGEKLKQQLSYWKEKLNNYENLNLPIDKIRPNPVCYVGDNVYFNIDQATSFKLRELAKILNISLYSLLLGGFNLFLSSYSNQDDIVIGTPAANRHYHQLADLIGFFVNSLVLRSKIDKAIKVVDYLHEIGREIIEAQLHQDLPFEKLVDELNVSKDQSRNPIFQVMFGVQSFGVSQKTDKQLFKQSPNMVSYNVAKFGSYQ